MHERLSELIQNAERLDNEDLQNANRTTAATQGDGSFTTQAVQDATRAINQLQAATQGSIESLSANTEALGQTSQAHGGGATKALETAVGGAFGGGLLGGGVFGTGLELLFDGIKGLFGGGPATPTPLTSYSPPPSRNFELATADGIIGQAVYNSASQPREVDTSDLALSAMTRTAGRGVPNGSGGASPSSAATHITVQVNAMDSRSFLDHSSDIASAVREAMLNMHSINDVVGDL